MDERTRRLSIPMLLAVCLALIGLLAFPSTAHAKKITSLRQAAKLAAKEVKNADVTEIDTDYEKGQLVYEVQLIKGTKEYEITYRAADGKMLSYDMEEHVFQRNSKKKIMSRKKCQNLALKKVPGGKIVSLAQKYDDGIPMFKVKLTKNTKRYTLKYHARTGKLLEYGWEAKTFGRNPSADNGYIGLSKAENIALAKIPGSTVVKAESDRDDGIPVYEITLVKGAMEYDITIHARSGKILEIDTDPIGLWW